MEDARPHQVSGLQLECFRRTDASAPPAESSRTPKNFFAKASFTQRLPPLWDRTIFGQVFVRGGMTEFSKWKVPLPGGQARRNKLLVSWGPLVIAPALAGVKNQSGKSPLPGGPCPWGRHVPQQRNGAEQLSSLGCLAAGGRRRLSHCYNLTPCGRLSRKDMFSVQCKALPHILRVPPRVATSKPPTP